MSRRRRTAAPPLALLLAVVTVAAPGLRAQAPEAVGPNTLASTSDSVRRLAELDAAVRHHRHDGALWHEKGLLAWGLVYSHQRDAFISRREDIAHLRAADEALRMATQVSPDSARYWLDLQRFLLHSAAPSARSAAGRMARDAAAAAARAGDRALEAESYDREGVRSWRNYEALSRRDLSTRDVGGGTLEPAEFDPAALAAINRTLTGDTESDFGGETDYRRAELQFNDAVHANPNLRSARRHLYMLLTERGRWEQLRATAFARTSEAPTEADGWLALGLAAHRVGDDETSTRAFDRGLALLPPDERRRLTDLTRILAPHPAAGRIDSATFVNATPARRAVMERAYWSLADPVTLTPVNEHRLEFYARVETAELLWTTEEANVRGADTERGDVLVRFGPPSLVLRSGTDIHQVTEWRYPYRRFYFSTPAGFGTAKLVSESYTLARDFREAVPVSWRDAPAARPDSVRVQVARFRAEGDSAAVYVAANLPVRKLAAGVARGAASVDVGFTLFDASVEPVLRDSSRLHVAAADTASVDARAWRGTVPPGEYGVRVEGFGVASRRAASGANALSARPAHGFGLSDLLVAASVQPGANGGRRWTDFSTVPNAGVFRRGAPVALLWETYGLAAGADSVARYRVTVAVEPLAHRDAVTGFVARIVGGAAGAIGIGGRSGGDGRLTLSFDRQAPARPALADYLTLDLGGAPAGRYSVTVSVEDSLGHVSTATMATLEVVE